MDIERDRKTLQLYTEGKTQQDIAAQVVGGKQSTVYDALKYYRQNGVLVDRTVNWPQFEAKSRQRKKYTRNIKSNTAEIQHISASNTELEELLSWWRQQKAKKPLQRAGRTKAASFRMDEAVLRALRRYAKQNHRTHTDCLSEAVELLLSAPQKHHR